ncbi:Protein of unknown function [Marinobacter daqiaonensis]|uniref:DUF2789 domain-containing protein n=1 Tax=Marinobacter daqiaonensis TaxID=650891 RepID=A0A1I6GPY7_9GAMM|nr:DUF2789 domain-containing protein [Marinobacter daqiaonensis]SFR44171.1 Protein of unknown function [Marinobacter daqiaonensis]
MEQPNHTLSELFKQLGLPDDNDSIEAFIEEHRPLPESTTLPDAPFWNESQKHFLREEWQEDADWAEMVDTLNNRLR